MHNNWEIDIFDFNGTYLNSKLNDNKQIYIEPPPRYGNQGESIKFLLKFLYGLKQAGCKWYDTLVCTLADKGFHVSNTDPGILLQSWALGPIFLLFFRLSFPFLTDMYL